MLLCTFANSSALAGRGPRISRSSLFSSIIDSFVLSVCTIPYARNGCGPRALNTRLPEPYDQCLSSRKFILIREVKAPPRIVFIASIAIASGLFFGTVTFAGKIIDCCAPGLSKMYTLGLSGRFTAARFFFGTSPAFQLLNNFSNRGFNSSIVISPTTIIVAMFGLIHV